jgi:alpha-aminoadipic semialdehyde synthase
MWSTVIRKEHKNQWERRTPLNPDDAARLQQAGVGLSVERSPIRIYPDTAYEAAGLPLVDTPDAARVVVGIKEPPVASIRPGQIHLCFSHTIKGQDYNMPLLQRFLDQKATLLDYELITDDSGKRTIAFGRFAGIAGAVDTLWAYGQKLLARGRRTPCLGIQQTWRYGNIKALKEALASINMLEGEPCRVLIVGTGKVGQGAEEVCQWLGLPKLETERFLQGHLPEHSFYAVVSSRHLHARKDGGAFDFAHFVEHGKAAYESTFHKHLGKFDVLLQTPYWEPKYPRHLPLSVIRDNASRMPAAIGDISCDIDGSLACTHRATDIDDPVYTYYPEDNRIESGIQAEGVAVMAIDNLPCELPQDASDHFSRILPDYLPHIASMNPEKPLEETGLPEALRRACIVLNGELTPRFEYLRRYL